QRFARPGRRGIRPIGMGVVSRATERFAVSIGRSVPVRRMLAGPGTIRTRRFDPVAAPPRWWIPPVEPGADTTTGWSGEARSDAMVASGELPRRGLARAARRVPTEDTYDPGAFSTRMRGTPIRPRRIKEVSDVGQLSRGPDRLVRPRRAPSESAAA